MNFVAHSISELEPVCQEVIRQCNIYSVFALYGDPGSGKTTLVQAICKKLGVQESVTSPSYSIVNEHEIDGKIIYHIDLFRIKSAYEALQTGLEEYLFSGHLCFVGGPTSLKISCRRNILKYLSVNWRTMSEASG